MEHLMGMSAHERLATSGTPTGTTSAVLPQVVGRPRR
jgi:hypothetical protein